MAIEAAGPFTAIDVTLIAHADSSATQATSDALDQAISAGFAPTDIALLSFNGRDKSPLAVLDRLGAHALRSFTGSYDGHGAPIYRGGDIWWNRLSLQRTECAVCDPDRGRLRAV